MISGMRIKLLGKSLKKNKGIIVSGSSGFVGRNLIKYLYDKKQFEYEILEVDRNQLQILNKTNFDELVLVHLASIFSLEDSKSKDIYNANVSFGLDVLNNIEMEKLTNIIYTNSIYSLDSEYKNYMYTMTKNDFSKILEAYKKHYNFQIQEFFLDNTYGAGDTRGKLLQLLIDSSMKNKALEIKYPDKFISLTDVNDVIDLIFNKIDSVSSSKLVVSSKKQYQIQSIKDFIDSKQNNKILKKENSIKFENEIFELYLSEDKIETYIQKEIFDE